MASVRIAISSTTPSSAPPAAAQQKSSSGGSSFEQLLNSASQAATPANSAAVPASSQKPSQSSTQDSSQNQTAAQNTANTTTNQATDQTANQITDQNTTQTVTQTPTQTATSQPQPQLNNISLLQLKDELQNLPGQDLSGQQGTAAGSLTTGDAKTAAGSATTNRTSGKQDKAQQDALSNAAAAQAMIAVPLNEQIAPVATVSSQQNNQQSGNTSIDAAAQVGSGASAGAASELVAAQITATVHDAPDAAGNTSRLMTSAKQPDAPKNELVDGDTKPDASASASDATAAASPSIVAPAALQNFALPLTLPVANAVTGNQQVTQAVGKATAKDATAASKNPDITSAPDAGNNKTSPTTSSDTSSQAAPVSVPVVQHAQFDPSQVVVTKSTDAGTASIAAVATPIHAVSADATVTHRADSAPADASALSAQRSDASANISDHIEAASASGINTARVIQSMSESEMRVGMRSTEFGDISIRTSISQQQMVAQISLDHTDLGLAIAAHVSTVQAKLGTEYGLHAQIEVSQQGSSFAGDQGQSSAREQKPYASSYRIDNSNLSSPESDSGVSVLPLAAAGSSSRLDIQA